jgi:hypothetical protein
LIVRLEIHMLRASGVVRRLDIAIIAPVRIRTI